MPTVLLPKTKLLGVSVATGPTMGSLNPRRNTKRYRQTEAERGEGRTGGFKEVAGGQIDRVHVHLICSDALINELADRIGDKVGNGSEAGKRRTGRFGKRPCGGVDDVDVQRAIGAGVDRNVDEVLAPADENFIGKNCGAQAEKSLHACCGGDLQGSQKFALTDDHKAPQRVCAERASTIGRS